MKLQAVTIDGTVIEADQFQTQKEGVKLERKMEDGKKAETIGFVPIDRLMYIIPEEVTHNIDELEEVPA